MFPKFDAFSNKHIDYLLKSKDNKYNVAEGAVRAAKTIINILAFKMALEETPDKIHLASGSTIANAKLNIGECNGFGLEHLWKHTHWGKYKDNEALFIQIGSEEKIVIFGDYKSHVDLEWRKMKKIEIVNGITTKLVFHFKYKTEEVYLYSYQRTFKLIKALKHFGNGIEVTERWKIFKLLYVPFW